jgi:serine/threonine-protein kinase
VPDSVFVERTGKTRVLDAGVWAVAARTALAGNHVGARYFAPEQLDGRCDSRTDVFALGLLLWEMLAARPPRHARNFRALSEEIRTTSIPNLGRLVRPGAPVVARSLGELVARALDPEPSGRFATPLDLAIGLVEITHPVTEAEAAVMLGLTRSSGARPRARPDALQSSSATHSQTGGARRQLDTLPYPLDEGAVLADAPLVISAEPEADDSSRETLPSFDVGARHRV